MLLRQEIDSLKEKLSQTEKLLEIARQDIAGLEKEKEGLLKDLGQEKNTNTDLSNNLIAEQAKNTSFESQIKTISSAVGTLTKLSQTDKELLKKYSRVYFLSENYIPQKLAQINPMFLSDKTKTQYLHTSVMPFFESMMLEASSTGSPLQVISAYRSFEEQAAVKTGYKIVYGEGANKFSADQGYSEHQLGTTIDLAPPKTKTLSLQFENQPGYKWLVENAHRFGFILSYPKGNSYYQFEPWHWRFVGVNLAKKLHDEKRSFYDLTQREIDEYLISIFDW